MNINLLSPVTMVGSHFVEFQFGMELIKQNLYQNCYKANYCYFILHILMIRSKVDNITFVGKSNMPDGIK